MNSDWIIGETDQILVTGAGGFLGARVVETLCRYGFRRIRCFVRPSSNLTKLQRIAAQYPDLEMEFTTGNLLNREHCARAAVGVKVLYHLAAGTGDKSFAGAYLNSVVTLRNMLEALSAHAELRRFVNVSSFSVYSGTSIRPGALLDETCPLEEDAQGRHEAYCFGKLKQDQFLIDYGRQHNVPYVILRPGVIYGPGRSTMTGRVGVGTFGLYLHLGGSNKIPLTYVDNCADAVARAGFVPGIDGQVFNVVDDDLPASRALLRMYKQQVKSFRSVYVPHPVARALCGVWEWYADWSHGQLPPAFNRRRFASYWQGNAYSNQKLKLRVGWTPGTPTAVALKTWFDACRQAEGAKS